MVWLPTLSGWIVLAVGLLGGSETLYSIKNKFVLPCCSLNDSKRAAYILSKIDCLCFFFGLLPLSPSLSFSLLSSQQSSNRATGLHLSLKTCLVCHRQSQGSGMARKVPVPLTPLNLIPNQSIPSLVPLVILLFFFLSFLTFRTALLSGSRHR